MNQVESGILEPTRAGQMGSASVSPPADQQLSESADRAGNDGQVSPYGSVRQVIGACFAFSILIAFIYIQTIQFDFVNYDDNVYVYENPHVLGGPTKDNLLWALTTTHAWNWHPLTWVSHMLDAALYKTAPGALYTTSPGGNHITSALLHLVTTIVLFLAFRRLTGNWRRSAFVAAVFAVHPLRVESVAWVSERKDVLSGFFFALVLLAYAGYARRPSVWRYALVTLALVFGLMSKPMLVTVPFVLLLLDYWPLSRMMPNASRPPGAPSLGWLLIEKAPLLVLAAAASAVTVYAQDIAIQSMERVSFSARVSNAGVSYLAYIGQMFWPSGLAVLYNHPLDQLPLWQAAGAWLSVAGATVAAFAVRRRWPYLLVGWLWYLGMLVPVIGFVQVGGQARADRYTYLPQLGLVMAIAWWLADLAASRRLQRWVLIAPAIGIIVVLSWSAQRQAKHWRNGVTLWSRVADCDPTIQIAQYGLGQALSLQGRYSNDLSKFEEAIPHFQAVLAVNAKSREAAHLCGLAFVNLGKFEDALGYLRRWVELDASSVAARTFLGEAFYRTGRVDEAEIALQTALDQNPQFAFAHDCLGLIRARQRRFDEAVAEHRVAIALEPNNELWRAHLGIALYQSGKPHDAMTELREAVRLEPDDANVLRIAAWVAATARDDTIRSGTDAVIWSQRAVELSRGQDPLILDCLAASYAEAGRYAAAVDQSKRAIDLAAGRHMITLANAIRAHQIVYQSEKPLRVSPSDLQP